MRSDVWTETYSSYFAAAVFKKKNECGALTEKTLDRIAEDAAFVAQAAAKRAHMARAEAEVWDEKVQKVMREAGIK